MLSIILSTHPPSVNHAYVNANGRRFRSKTYKDWIDFSMEETIDQLPDNFECIPSKVSVSIDVYTKSKRKRDLDNYLKAICDLLNGWIIADDYNIDQILITRHTGCIDKINIDIATL